MFQKILGSTRIRGRSLRETATRHILSSLAHTIAASHAHHIRRNTVSRRKKKGAVSISNATDSR